MREIANANRKITVLGFIAAFVLCMGLLAGCSSASSGESEADATASDAPQAEPEAPAGDEYTGQVEYGGITFDIPEGWTAVVSDSALSVQFPGGGASDASVQGTITLGAVAEGDEQGSVDAYVDDIMQMLSQQEGYELSDYEAAVEGVPSKAVKCSLSSNDKTVEVYVVAVAVDDDVTNLIMASSEGEYNEQYEAVIGSIALAE